MATHCLTAAEMMSLRETLDKPSTKSPDLTCCDLTSNGMMGGFKSTGRCGKTKTDDELNIKYSNKIYYFNK